MSRLGEPETTPASTLLDAVGVVTDRQTYRNLLYLAVAFPLGVFYFVMLTTGFALGLGLAVLLVGLGILFVTVVGLRAIASFERQLANTLLGTSIPSPNDVVRDGTSSVATGKRYLQAGSTWRGLGFVMVKFWLGIVSFVLLVTFLGTAVELVALPLFPDGVLNVTVANWHVAESFGTATQRVIAVPAGVILAVVGLNVSNAFARLNASVASSLLGPAS